MGEEPDRADAAFQEMGVEERTADDSLVFPFAQDLLAPES